MPQKPPARDQYGRFQRRTPSCWNDRRNTQKILKIYTKTNGRLDGRPVVEIETRVYKKRAVPAILVENQDEDDDDEDDPFADERPEKRQKVGHGMQTLQPPNPSPPDSNGLRFLTHPTRMAAPQIQRVRTHGGEMRKRPQSLREVLAMERGTAGYPGWYPRSEFGDPSPHLKQLFKTRQNIPQNHNRLNFWLDENAPPPETIGQNLCGIQAGLNGVEAHTNSMRVEHCAESRTWGGFAMPQRPVPVLAAISPSPPLFCSPENNSTAPITKPTRCPSSADPNISRTDRGPSTPPPRFRFTSPVPTDRDTPTPTPHSKPKRRRGIPFRKAFLVPSVEPREISTISETPLLEMESRDGSPDLDEPPGPRKTQEENLVETRELIHYSCPGLNQNQQEPTTEPSRDDSDEAQGPQKTQPNPLPDFRDLDYRSRRNSSQSRASVPSVLNQGDLVNCQNELARKSVPLQMNMKSTSNPKTPLHLRYTPDSEAESEVTKPPQPPTRLSPPCSSPILAPNRARPSSSSFPELAEPPSTPGLTSDASMSPQNLAVTPSPTSLSAPGYTLRVTKFDGAGNKSSTRTINVPATYTFEQLHRGLLSAFCLPPNLRYNFGLLKLSKSDKERGFGHPRPYPRERVLLAGAGAWRGGFETCWRAGDVGVGGLLGEIEGEREGLLELWWGHEGARAWTHGVEYLGRRGGVERGWCMGERGGGNIFF